ncbi:MAG: VIT and VWA domain-containing protein [Desulfomonilaceae bacterium]
MNSTRNTLSDIFGIPFDLSVQQARALGIAIVTFLGLLMPLLVQAEGPRETKTLSPYFFVESGNEGLECFPLKATSVTATINGVIADVKVTQEYANLGKQPISARYVFPAFTRAAVHGMRMTVGEDVVVAQIKEREAAKQQFEKAKAAGKSASLLEQQRPNVFTMSVANIMPGDKVTIELHYSELLVPEKGTYEFVYPTVVGPRYSTIPEAGAADHHQWLKNPYLKENKEPTSTFAMNVTLAAGMPIQQVASSTHATDVTWDNKSQARITLAKSESHGGNRDFILGFRLAGDRILSGLLLYKGDKANYFTLMVQPPARVVSESIPPREYIFVVDVSGSMNGFPLETAKVLLRQLIGGLRPTDSFNVVLFEATARVMAPRSLPADQANVTAALSLIGMQPGGGGTELYSALEKALALPRVEGTARTVILITDGYIAAERNVFGLISNNLNQSNLFAFGIGRSVNRYLIEGVAKAGQGEPFVVTEPQAAADAAMRFKAYVQSPVLTGISIDFGSFEAYDTEPAIQGDLFAERPLVICGKWRGRGEGTIRLRGTTGSGPYNQSLDVAKSKPSEINSALPYLWARKRVSRLTDFAPREADAETRKQVTQLGLDYQLLTRYTSFVAVHEQVRNCGAPAQDVLQPLPLPKGVSNLAVGSRNVPEPDLYVMLALMCFVALVTLWRRRQRNPMW